MLGHGQRVAERHYLQVTDDHFAKAIGEAQHRRSSKRHNIAELFGKKRNKNAKIPTISTIAGIP
jgi:hypothetical protein